MKDQLFVQIPLHYISHLVHVVLIPNIQAILPNLQISDLAEIYTKWH